MNTPSAFPSAPACLLIAFTALLGGCTTSTYIVQVDAIAQSAEPMGPAQPKSYQIRTNNPKLDEGSLRYKEVADYVRTALSGRGMYEAPRADKADVVIDIDFGMDSPRVKFETEAAKVSYAEQGGGVHQEEVPVYDKTGVLLGYRTVEVVEPSHMELMRDEGVIRPVIVYEKFLKLSARSNQASVEGRQPPEVWSVNVSAEDESKELRKYLPILASATADYIGLNTKQEKPVKLKDSDEVVGFIKKGM